MSKMVLKELTHTQKVRMLYKTVLRLHRGLPTELKDLGDKYARDEFRRHKKCKPEEADVFMTEWARYAVTITKQLGLKGKPTGTIGDTLDEEILKKLDDNQTVQLYELMLAAKGIDKSNQEILINELSKSPRT